MSAFDLAGVAVWTPLAVLFWLGALTPGRPPHPRYGERELGCFCIAVTLSLASAFCICRLFGGTL
jgi:hypothetical protein